MRTKVYVEVGGTTDATFEYVECSSEINVSNVTKVFSSFTTLKNIKGFQLSGTTQNITLLNGNSTFFPEKGYPGFISSAIRDTTEYAYISFKILNSIPEYIYITFDTATGAYPYFLRITSGTKSITITNPGVIAQIPTAALNLTIGATVSVRMELWTMRYQSYKVLNISPRITAKEGIALISYKCSENMMDSNLNIAPGICEQYADITFYDKNKLFHQLALSGLLTDNDTVKIYEINDNNEEVLVGSYLIDTWDIEATESDISIHARDISYILESLNISKLNVETRSVNDFLTIAFGNLPWKYLDEATELRCYSIGIPNSWYAGGTVADLLNLICQIGMLRIYWSIDTYIVGRCC